MSLMIVISTLFAFGRFIGSQEVKVSSSLTNFPSLQRAVTEEDLRDILTDNLEQDLKPWRSEARAQGALTSLDFLDLLYQIDKKWPEYWRNFIAIVLIHSGKISWWAYPTARKWCTSRVQYMQKELEKYQGQGNITLADTIFVMNAYDKPLCPAGTCAAPLFTFNKPWVPQVETNANKRGWFQNGIDTSDSLEETSSTSSTASQRRSAMSQSARDRTMRLRGQGSLSVGPHGRAILAYDDVLFPVLNHPFDQIIDFPWPNKTRKAFMRAGIYAAMDAKCSRVKLHQASKTVKGKQLLDVGIYKNKHWKVKVELVDPIPMEDHARWRYLLNSDGQGASWRLAKLLAINSLVLKARSNSIEYYYRSLREGRHFISVDEKDVVQVIESLESVGDGQLAAITSQAQTFAYQFLSQVSRCAYASISLGRYTRLYEGGLSDILSSLGGKVPSMDLLLGLRSAMKGNEQLL